MLHLLVLPVVIDTHIFSIIAQGDGGSPAGGIGDPLLLILLGMLGLLVFLTFRRGRKMRRQQQEAHSSAVVGAEVVMAGGVVGTIVARDEEQQRVTLEFSNGDRVDFLIGAVQQVLTQAPGQRPAADDDENA